MGRLANKTVQRPGASRREEIDKPLACIKKPDMNKSPQRGRFEAMNE
jgi:hypothetical protein